jgi:hypothetical protein
VALASWRGRIYRYSALRRGRASGDEEFVTVRSLCAGYWQVSLTLRRMSAEFLTDDEAAVYGRYAEPPSQADLDRVLFLEDEDRALIGRPLSHLARQSRLPRHFHALRPSVM